mgnify:CR=1 FL=1
MGIGASKTLEEQIKENKRNINRAIRELDRERTKLERQEKKIEREIKKAAKENQMDAVKIMAKVCALPSFLRRNEFPDITWLTLNANYRTTSAPRITRTSSTRCAHSFKVLHCAFRP